MLKSGLSSIFKKRAIAVLLFCIIAPAFLLFFGSFAKAYSSEEHEIDKVLDCGNEKLVTPNLMIPIPGVKFSDNPSLVQCGSSKCITIPFLAQYVSGLFKYMVGVSLIVSSIIIVYGGFLYIVSATGVQMQSAKEKIIDAVVGLAVFLGSYIILFNINPNLTKEPSLIIPCPKNNTFVLNDEPPVEDQGQIMSAEAKDQLGNSVTYPTRLCETVENCAKFCTGAKTPPNETTGMAKLNQMQAIPNTPGLIGNNKLLRPDAILALKRAGTIAQNWPGGPYTIYIYDAYRPLSIQIQTACKIIEDNPDALGINVAFPGGSLHGIGVAIDLGLKKDGKDLTTCCSVSTQTRDITEENAQLLQQIMSSAGFNRYCREIWHFEWKTEGATNRSKSCSWPPS
jgi:D-alanyl-D-alanine dipeptidase